MESMDLWRDIILALIGVLSTAITIIGKLCLSSLTKLNKQSDKINNSVVKIDKDVALLKNDFEHLEKNIKSKISFIEILKKEKQSNAID